MTMETKLKNFEATEFTCLPGSEGFLGSGSFAVVRLAFHKVLGPVALKCYSIKQGKPVLEMVENEMILQHGSNNENIVRVFGYTQWKDNIAVVMEYCNHGSLEKILLNSDVELPVPLTMHMCTEVARGLNSIHNFNKHKRLVHCDVKPGNTLISKDFHCKLSDFGGAKLCNYTNALTSTENPSRDQYTLAYTAPEVLNDPSYPLTKEQDVYSFGMMVYSFLTRQPPFTTSSEVFVAAVKSGTRPNTDRIKETLRKKMNSRDLESLKLMQAEMERCWLQNPKNRPNMLDVKQRLEAQLAKYKQWEINGDIACVMKHLDVHNEVAVQKKNIPLDKFSPDTNSFVGTCQLSQENSTHVGSKKGTGIFPVGSELANIFRHNVQHASSKLEEYISLVGEEKYDEAFIIATQLLLTDKFVSADELEVIAEKQSKIKNYVLAAIFYFLAGALYKAKSNKSYALHGIERCCKHLSNMSKNMLAAEAANKKFVVQHLIPLMLNLTHIVQTLQEVDTEKRDQRLFKSLRHVQGVYTSLNNWKSSEDISRKSLEIAQSAFGPTAERYRIYAHSHYELGRSLKHQQKYQEALISYKQAIRCYNNMDDGTTQSEKKE